MYAVFLNVALNSWFKYSLYYGHYNTSTAMQSTKRIVDFLFSGALNGPLKSNFLKEQLYIWYILHMFSYNMESISKRLWYTGSILIHRNLNFNHKIAEDNKFWVLGIK